MGHFQNGELSNAQTSKAGFLGFIYVGVNIQSVKWWKKVPWLGQGYIGDDILPSYIGIIS